MILHLFLTILYVIVVTLLYFSFVIHCTVLIWKYSYVMLCYGDKLRPGVISKVTSLGNKVLLLQNENDHASVLTDIIFLLLFMLQLRLMPP